MKRATLAEAIGIMRNGNHCLWVGAGATIQLVGFANAPSWQALVEKLEEEAGLTALPKSGEFPERLDQCKAILGELKFRQVVRAKLHDPMYLHVIQIALNASKAGTLEVPPSFKALAHLGAIGNPIVSFNIEMATAIALSIPNGPALIKSYSKTVSHHLPYNVGLRPVKLARKIFLPHGCLELADCVLTADEYSLHKASMSFQLATHQAYASGLFIVGMSLADKYLLEQILNFRRWIGEIYWIYPNAGDDQQKLAEMYGLTLVSDGSWKDFWDNFNDPLHAALSPAPDELYKGWIKLIDDAQEYLGTPKRLDADSSLSSDEKINLLAQSDSAGEGRPLPLLSAEAREELRLYRTKMQAEQQRIRTASAGSP